MKKTTLILIAVISLLGSAVQAQGTLYLSNLGLTPTGSGVVGSDSWLAQGFMTGTNSGGYALNSVQLLMNAASGNPIGFTISIYDSSSFSPVASPQSSLGTLNGADPSDGGLFNYTDPSSLLLLPSTFYFVVVTANTPVSTGAYNWSATQNAQGSIWFLDNVYFYSPDGSDWSYARNHLFQLGIYATPVPEPSSLALFGLSLVSFGLWRRQKTAIKSYE